MRQEFGLRYLFFRWEVWLQLLNNHHNLVLITNIRTGSRTGFEFHTADSNFAKLLVLHVITQAIIILIDELPLIRPNHSLLRPSERKRLQVSSILPQLLSLRVHEQLWIDLKLKGEEHFRIVFDHEPLLVLPDLEDLSHSLIIGKLARVQGEVVVDIKILFYVWVPERQL